MSISLRPSATYYFINDKEYLLGEYSHGQIPEVFYNFMSLDKTSYPDHKSRMSDVRIAYRLENIAVVEGRDAVIRKVKGDHFIIWFQPRHPAIEIFKAKKIAGGGWFEAEIPMNKIQQVKEVRYPVDGFEFPEGLDTVKILNHFF
jgi:hypothetical protein